MTGSRGSRGRRGRTGSIACAQGGFTLVEVMVALAITAIALAAGLQASSALTRNAARQTQVLQAQLCAHNALVQMRLQRQLPPVGNSTSTCEQAGQALELHVAVLPTPNPRFRRVDAQVFEQGLPVLRVSTVQGRN